MSLRRTCTGRCLRSQPGPVHAPHRRVSFQESRVVMPNRTLIFLILAAAFTIGTTTSAPTVAPTVYPTPQIIGDDSGLNPTPFVPMDLCPAPVPLTCPTSLKASALWQEQNDRHTSVCDSGSTQVYTEDPSSGTLLHACTARTHGSMATSCQDGKQRGMQWEGSRNSADKPCPNLPTS